MNSTVTYERFPWWGVLAATLLALTIYTLGVIVMSRFGVIWAGLFVLYCVAMELHVLWGSCRDCYYYGKVCGFGKGKVCGWLFRQGDPRRFVEREIGWYHLIPDFLVLLFPLVGGIIGLIREFSWMIVFLLAALLMLCLVGNAVVRGQYACNYCRQREIGCPAEKLFSQKKNDPRVVDKAGV